MSYSIMFLIGLFGYILHVFLKYKESNFYITNKVQEKVFPLKNFNQLNILLSYFWAYIKENNLRVTISFGSFLLVYILSILPIKDTTFIAIKSALHLTNLGLLNYFLLGYFADSIVRNIGKLLQTTIQYASEEVSHNLEENLKTPPSKIKRRRKRSVKVKKNSTDSTVRVERKSEVRQNVKIIKKEKE